MGRTTCLAPQPVTEDCSPYTPTPHCACFSATVGCWQQVRTQTPLIRNLQQSSSPTDLQLLSSVAGPLQSATVVGHRAEHFLCMQTFSGVASSCAVVLFVRRPSWPRWPPHGLLGVASLLTLSLHSKLHIFFALLAMTSASASVAIADVTIDACVAQNSIAKPSLAPDMQSLCGLCSSIGALLGFSISGILVHAIGSQVHKKFLQAGKSMWSTLKCPEVWRPCVYMYMSFALSLNIQEGMFYWYTNPKEGPSFSQGIRQNQILLSTWYQSKDSRSVSSAFVHPPLGSRSAPLACSTPPALARSRSAPPALGRYRSAPPVLSSRRKERPVRRKERPVRRKERPVAIPFFDRLPSTPLLLHDVSLRRPSPPGFSGRPGVSGRFVFHGGCRGHRTRILRCPLRQLDLRNTRSSTQIYELTRHVLELKQGTLTVSAYYSEFERLYQELEYFNIFTAACTAVAQALQKDKNRFRVHVFLMGLNMEFEAVRLHVLHREILSSLREAFSMLLIDENCRRSLGSSTDHSALAGISRGPPSVCSHCGKKDHTKDVCFRLHPHLAPPGRGSTARGIGGHRDGGRPTGLSSAHGVSSSPSEWIIDSGATNHMTDSASGFTSYTSLSGRGKVIVVNGSLSSIAGKGTVACSPDLSLSSVLHVPHFLAIFSPLTTALNCSVIFFPDVCVFRDLDTKWTLDSDRNVDGLYLLNQSLSPSALSSARSLTLHDIRRWHQHLDHPSALYLTKMFSVFNRLI
ncbi:putative folate-biopterin transporter 2 [Platanthera zijinensis]|uniref:Folate-biopterin transporter 2 n=1 Tax=Platanthera zijinensis TaxID=2320716 RepID=A0AAP0AYV9_9ASPA